MAKTEIKYGNPLIVEAAIQKYIHNVQMNGFADDKDRSFCSLIECICVIPQLYAELEEEITNVCNQKEV